MPQENNKSSITSPPPELATSTGKIYPNLPGIGNFMNLCNPGYLNPESAVAGAGPNLKGLLKGIFKFNQEGQLDQLIHLLPEEGSSQPTDDQVFSLIRIDNLVDSKTRETMSPDIQNLGDALTVMQQSSTQTEGAELIKIIIDQAVEEHSSSDGLQINVGTTNYDYSGRVARLASILGITPEQANYGSLEQLLTYLNLLVDRVDDVDDFLALQTSYAVSGKHLTEVVMLNDVAIQQGAECVLYSTYNLARAALNQGALIEPVSVDQMKQTVPQAMNGFYEMGNSWKNYITSKGMEIVADFNWGQAAQHLENKTGGLILRLGETHAVAVVGIRQSERTADWQGPKIEFLVANSLPTYWPTNQENSLEPVWVDGQTLIAKTNMRPAGSDYHGDNFLVTWNNS